MSSDDEDDLFGGGSDSDDTAELLAASTSGRLKKGPPPAATKKKAAAAAPAKKTAPKKKGSDDEGGLFDSSSSDDDSDDDDDDAAKKKPALSKKERLQALAAKKRGSTEPTESASTMSGQQQSKKSGYDSEDSYESATYVHTKEDDDFIDTTGEDPDAVAELYAEQRFEDERGHKMTAGKKGRKRSHHDDDGDHPDRVYVDPNKVPDNPIMAAVYKMKKKQRTKKTFTDLEEECKLFLGRMEQAAAEDEACFADKKPATNKLSMLAEVTAMLARKDVQRMLIDLDLLVLVKRWIQPLPNGQLGNLTVRQRMLDSIATMTGETGINSNDLKSSELGKTVMVLYKHKDETSTMKNGILRKLIDQWSRPIFQKSANHRDLERVGARGDRGLSALSRQQQYMAKMQQREQTAAQGTAADQKHKNLQSIIKGGTAGKTGVAASAARVSVPFSKGFQYSVRPDSKAPTPEKGSRQPAHGPGQITREKLSKKMQEKTRTVSKNNRSANVSVEGRAVK